MRHEKPYRLYLRKDTGYWFYNLPGQGCKTTGKSKEHEAHQFVIELLSAQKADDGGRHHDGLEGPAPMLREYAGDFFV